MNSTKQILVILVCLFLYATVVVAQERQPAMPSRDQREVTIIIQQQQLRFSAPASAQEVRLEVFNKNGESVYDSGLVSGPEISWGLQNANGEAVPGGLYSYTLTVKEAGSETSATRRGHLILESGRDRIWVTSQGAVGADESPSGGELTVSSGSETNVVGARIGKGLASKGSPINLDIFGTPGRIPMFTGSDSLDDSVISQDFNGRIGIGTTRPGTALLTVAGQIETTSGGIKFPNGTVQTSAGLSQVGHDTTLTGNGTGDAPLGVNIPALNLLSNVATNGTLAGNGTSASPLGVAVPLSLTSSSATAIMEISNNSSKGIGISVGGFYGVFAQGGSSINSAVGAGVVANGGISNSGVGGEGLIANGGFSLNSGPGDGIVATGGDSVNLIATGGEGIFAQGGLGFGNVRGLAGEFSGNVVVSGNLSKGGGSFKIDHPLDPDNKYLYHSFVESPDMKNVYDGVVTTDQNGEATVTMPDYFEALNRDFRYQLTVIGQFAQAIIASEISGNSFTIKTDRPGVKVSWQVTGIRQDAYANKHRIPVEEDKPERERGYYIHPEVFNQPEEKSVEWARHPEMMRQIKSRRQET